jgi:hypothetical protein
MQEKKGYTCTHDLHHYMSASSPVLTPIPLLILIAVPTRALLSLWRRIQKAFWDIVPVLRSSLWRRGCRVLRPLLVGCLLVAGDFVVVVFFVFGDVVVLVEFRPVNVLQLYVAVGVHAMFSA